MPAHRIKRIPRVPSLSWEDCRLLVDSVIDYAIFMLDTEGHVASWNAGAERIKGYTADEIIGAHFSTFYPPEDRASGKPERLLEIARREGHVEDQGVRVRKDGSRFWASVIVTALWDDKKNLRGFGKVTRDLTAQRTAEERERKLLREQTAREVAEASERRVRESETRYRNLSRRLEVILEGVGDGITVQDRTGRIVYANTAAARLCGFQSVEELVGMPQADVLSRFEMFDEGGAPLGLEQLPGRRVLAGAPEARALLRVRNLQSGTETWTQVRSKAAPDGESSHDLAINIWHDVTAGHREEQRARFLAEATAALGSSLVREEMLSKLAKTVVPGLCDWCTVYLLDGERLHDVVSVHADPRRSATVAELRRRFLSDGTWGRGIRQVAATGTAELVREVTEERLKRSTNDPDVLRILRGLDVKSVVMAPIRVRERILGVLVLVSTRAEQRYDTADLELVEELGRKAGVAVENVQLYAAAQEAAQEAEQASQAKDQFLATVSHELRTPLSAVLGWSELLRARVTDPGLVKPLDVIYRNALAQVKIIDDILDVSRVITGKFRIEPKPVDLFPIITAAVEVIRPSAAAKRIDIEVKAQPKRCLLIADEERLQQVVWNLLSNAVKFTDPGGRVTVQAGMEGSNVVLSVADTGRGLDPAFLPHVFERFRQADSTTTRRVGGLGLGLALVRHIVELHGGEVRAESEGLQKGSTFTITLPIRAVTPKEEESSQPAPAPATNDALRDVRVLVVDDEADARELVATVLQEAGATVETASSSATGHAAFLRFRPHVIVSDIGMPDEDGLAFMHRIRALPPSEGGAVPSLALTAFARDEDRARALQAGYADHVGKPVEGATLVRAVAGLAGREPVSRDGAA